MKFVDLYDRVKNNQKMAMRDDKKLSGLTKKERERFIENRKAQERADNQQDTIQRILNKHDIEKKEETERRALIQKLTLKRYNREIKNMSFTSKDSFRDDGKLLVGR